MASKSNNPMPREERAKQFMPFAALKGLDEALAAKEKVVVEKRDLSEEQLAELDQQFSYIEKGKIASVVYYKNGEYIKQTGIVARLDTNARILQIVNTKIDFADIAELKSEE